MKTLGVHLLCELSDCNRDAIANVEAVKHALYSAASAANATALNGYFHKFSPTGISGLICLAESHLSIHTWPEVGYAAIDVFTCGDTTDPHTAMSLLAAVFEARHVQIREISRGLESNEGSYFNKDTTQKTKKAGQYSLAAVEQTDPAMNRAWYVEDADPHERHLYSVADWLVNAKSKFQEIGIIRNRSYGKVLFLDGAVQSSQRDEHLYHESLVHPAMIIHPDPKRVLILGGGEGASLREVLKHNTVEHATMVDIDGELVELCRQHLPEWSAGAFEDPRTRLIIGDGKDWIEKCNEKFDLIIMDLTDQIDLGPSFQLYTQSFYQTVKSRLNKNGIFLVQAGELSICEYFSHATIRNTLATAFSNIESYLQHIPTFFAQWSFILASESKPAELSAQEIESRIKTRVAQKLRFYDATTHQRLFMMPSELLKVLSSSGTIVDQVEDFAAAYERSQTVYSSHESLVEVAK